LLPTDTACTWIYTNTDHCSCPPIPPALGSASPPGIQQRQDIFDGKIELLAIFCNPSRIAGMTGRQSLITPLKLMHELMFLLQAMPREHKEVRALAVLCWLLSLIPKGLS
jgi:hypothetical protein